MAALHVVVFPFPAAGHYTPVTEFCKLLVSNSKDVTTIYVTYIVSQDRKQLGLGDEEDEEDGYPNIRVVNLTDAMADLHVPVTWLVLMRGEQDAQDALSNLFARLETDGEEGIFPPPCCLVTDFFLPWTQEVVSKLKIPRYILLAVSSMSASVFFHVPRLVEQGRIPVQASDVEPISDIPGVPTFLPSEMIAPLLTSSDPIYEIALNGCHRLVEAKGYIFNSFDALDGSLAVAGILDWCRKSGKNEDPSAYLVGPLLDQGYIDGDSVAHVGEKEDECLQWLHKQPDRSVLYFALGSHSTLTAEQMLEFAHGLEASCQRFLWVVHVPQENRVKVSSHVQDMASFLPSGFEERTRGRGFLVTDWAPQKAVLAHPAVGGFLTHCGWGSTLESICRGVPMLAWPQQAEQSLNCRIVVDKLNVAMELKKCSNGLVTKEEVEKKVKMLMVGQEGEMLNKSVCELRDAARTAIKPTGSSSLNLQAFVDELRLQNQLQIQCSTDLGELAVPFFNGVQVPPQTLKP